MEEKEKLIRPAILIVGETGSGKTTSLRNLPPERTVVLNTERKQLSFKNAGQFKNIMIDSYKKFKTTFEKAMQSDNYEYIVIDSFTGLQNLVFKYCELAFNGYTVWAKYNEMLADALEMGKDTNKFVIYLGHPEPLMDGDSLVKEYCKIKGKELKYGGIEFHFSIVGFTRLVDSDNGAEFLIDFNPSSKTTSRMPMGLLDTNTIENDIKLVTESIDKYYGQ